VNADDIRRIETLARINVEDVAMILNVPDGAIRVLIKHRLLEPLGSPRANSVRWFARVTIMRLAQDEKFLHKMTLCLEKHYRERNSRQRDAQSSGSSEANARNAA
jgi:hypothetical protein